MDHSAHALHNLLAADASGFFDMAWREIRSNSIFTSQGLADLDSDGDDGIITGYGDG